MEGVPSLPRRTSVVPFRMSILVLLLLFLEFQIWETSLTIIGDEFSLCQKLPNHRTLPIRKENEKPVFLKNPFGYKMFDVLCDWENGPLSFSCLPIVRRREWHGAFYFPSPEWLERTNVYETGKLGFTQKKKSWQSEQCSYSTWYIRFGRNILVDDSTYIYIVLLPKTLEQLLWDL